MLDDDNNKQKTIFGIPCKGCTDRSEIMGAGNWKVDAIILASVALIVGAIIFVQYEKHGK